MSQSPQVPDLLGQLRSQQWKDEQTEREASSRGRSVSCKYRGQKPPMQGVCVKVGDDTCMFFLLLPHPDTPKAKPLRVSVQALPSNKP